MIDHENLRRTGLRFQFQAKLFLNRAEERRSGSAWPGWAFGRGVAVGLLGGSALIRRPMQTKIDPPGKFLARLSLGSGRRHQRA
jgi:hypothetical protein